MERGPFTATISAPPVQGMGEDVICDIVITNNHDTDYYILTRNTPIEGLRSSIFLITNGDSFVHYDGILYKRVPPTEKDYVKFPHKSSKAATVVLSQAYKLDAPTDYSVMLDTWLLYAESPATTDPDSQRLTSNTVRVTLTHTGKQPQQTEAEQQRRKEKEISEKALSAKSPSFYGSWPYYRKQDTKTAYNEAYSQVDYGRTDVYNYPNRFKTYFGTGSKSYVAGIFKQVFDAMGSKVYTLSYGGNHCTKDTFAYTNYYSTWIYICEAFFEGQVTTGLDSHLGILVHELTHCVAHTDDIIPKKYGRPNALYLAANEPWNAVKNAGNYQYFVESFN